MNIFLTALLAAGTIAAISPTPVRAGQVAVNPQLENGWTAGYNGWSGGIAGFSFNLAAGTPGTYMWAKTQRLPATVNLDSISFLATWHNAYSGAAPFGVRLCYYGAAQWSANAGGECAGNKFTVLPAETPARRHTENLGMSCTVQNASLSPDYHCGGFQLEVASPQGAGDITTWMNLATLSDYTAPTVSNNHGSQTLNSAGWLRGTAQAGSNMQDVEGVGLNNAKLYVDGAQKANQNYSCNLASWVPCAQSVNFTPAFDTTSVADGPHTAFFTGTDIAANTAQSGVINFKVDNTKPDTPSAIEPVAAGMQGWSNVNSFGAQWTNGNEVETTSTQSGIASVIVDVNPTSVGQADPAQVLIPVGTTVSGISATDHSVSGISVPAIGFWTLRLSLVDKAGNVSGVGDGSAGTPDSDVGLGFDQAAPNSPFGQNNGWISRDELAAGFDQEFLYSAPPAARAPVCGFAGAIDEDLNGSVGTTINVPGGGSARKWRLPGTLAETTHYVHLRAVGCNGIPSDQTSTTEAKVDRSDPVSTISGVENGNWYPDGQLVTLGGTDTLSGMDAASDTDGDSRNGAYLSYSINGVGPQDKFAPRGGIANIRVTTEGQKEIRFAAVDLAGNRAPSKSASFGIDASNPGGYVHQQDPTRPTQLAAHLTDTPSGISHAIFYVRAIGGGDWIQLPTSLTGTDAGSVTGTASARFPDTALPQGKYDVRVAAFDRAGNSFTTLHHKDGALATVSNPMRDKTGVQLKLFNALRECKRDAKGKMKCSIKRCTKNSVGACYKVLKGKLVLQGGSSTVTTEYRRGSIATGTLTAASGKAIASANVVVSTIDRSTGTKREVGDAKTDSRGIYAIRIPAGVSKAVVAEFNGDELRQQTTATASMLTKAKLLLKVNTRHAKTGQTVTFSGRISSFDKSYPKGGKLAVLQFFAAKRWRPAVGITHSDKRGKFRFTYKFDGNRVRAKIIFRVAAPSEDGWGHVYSASKPIVLRLNY